jgi:hypothetical protein
MGALMLSVLLGTAFLSRQVWGVISYRIGGLPTVLSGSACPDSGAPCPITVHMTAG